MMESETPEMSKSCQDHQAQKHAIVGAAGGISCRQPFILLLC